MRLFIAITFSDSVKNMLSSIQDHLRMYASKGSFIRYENLHLTLAFLGEISKNQIDSICSIIDALSCIPFSFHFSTLDSFNGDLYWVGTEDAPSLTALQDALTSALLREGFSVDNKEFIPHLTLVRHAVMKQKPQFLIQPIQTEVHSISLMESTQEDGIPVYREIYRKEF